VKVRPDLPRPQKMLVWRMSEGSTLGEWVDPMINAAASPKMQRHSTFEVRGESWVSSSFDLFRGCDVSDNPNTVPGDLLDELFAPHDDTPKNPAKLHQHRETRRCKSRRLHRHPRRPQVEPRLTEFVALASVETLQ
jgi:hypothetical protein